MIAFDIDKQKAVYYENREDMLNSRITGKDPRKLRNIIVNRENKNNISEFINEKVTSLIGRGAVLIKMKEIIARSSKKNNNMYLIYYQNGFCGYAGKC